MPDTPPTDEPAPNEEAVGTASSDSPIGDEVPDTPLSADHEAAGEPGVPAPQGPMPPESPEAPGGPAGRGQRRITRETHTTTTRSQSETTTHETATTTEDVLLAPPVYAAPTSGHPRPVG